MRLRQLALFSIALLLSGAQAIAAPGDEIGSAVRIINLVTAEYETDERHLATGDNVRQDELIEVSSEGTGEIRLRDDTKLALGPGSRLLLDEFVYNPEISGGAIILNLAKGTFRFITGLAAKPAYVIRTPTASITVRGTIFDIYVQDSGLSWLLLIEGAIEVCNARDECRLHDEPGKLIRITPDGDLGNPVNWANFPDRELEPFDIAFPFVVAPPLIDPDPIFTPGDIVGDEPGNEDDGATPVRPQPLDCWSGWKKVPRGWRETDWKVKKRKRGNRVIHCAKYVPRPPLHCWSGWEQVPKGWRETGWKVKERRRGARVIFCAERVPLPPIHCWNGWFEIGAKQTNSYVRKGYKVKPHRKGSLIIWCAQNGKPPLPIACPPPAIGKLPFCKCGPGYKGRWPKCRKVEPPRPCKPRDIKCQCKLKGLPYNRKTGKCGSEPRPDPKQECLKKGWKWIRGRCVKPTSPKEECLKKGWQWKRGRCIKPSNPKKECRKKGWKWIRGRCVKPSSPKEECLKKGWKWKRNRCVKPSSAKETCLKKGWKWKRNRCVKPNSSCPKGYVGKPPVCVKVPKKCPEGFRGKWPNCKKKSSGSCSKGFVGRPPNCKKLTLRKPIIRVDRKQFSTLNRLKQRRR